MKNNLNILAFHFMNINTHTTIHVCFVPIYCKKKLRFPILIFVMEEIKNCTLMFLASQLLNSNSYKHLPIVVFKYN